MSLAAVHRFRAFWLIVVAVLAGLPTVASAQANFRIFVQFDGVVGTTTDPNSHREWSEAISFAQEAEFFGGSVTTIKILKEVDDASPALRLALAAGLIFSTADIEVVPSGNLASPFIRVGLTNAKVVEVTEAGSGPDGRPRELIAIDFSALTVFTSAPPP